MPGHKIMTPFRLRGLYTVKDIAPAGDYTVTDDIATLYPVEGGAVNTLTVDRIYQDESGTWCADLTIGG